MLVVTPLTFLGGKLLFGEYAALGLAHHHAAQSVVYLISASAGVFMKSPTSAWA